MFQQDKTIDVIGLGDLILNFAYVGDTPEGIALYERQPAGATANMLAQIARLGGKAALVGELGNDEHGRYLYTYAEKCGVDMTNAYFGERPTRIMFVYYKENNDRYFSDFQMERNDIYTSVDKVRLEMVKSSRFITIKCMPIDRKLPAARTTQEMLRVARESDTMVAVDTQWRGSPMTDSQRREVRDKAAISDVVKLTDEEMAFYFDETDQRKGTDDILRQGKTQIVALTLDSRGSLLRTKNAMAYMPAYRVRPMDTTGAGDSYMGALLYRLCRINKPIQALTQEELADIADFCNACAAYSTTHRGSLAFMGTQEDVREVRASVPTYPSLRPAL